MTFNEEDKRWLLWAAEMEMEHGSFPTIGRSPTRKICDATPMKDVRVSCKKITRDIPTEISGRIYSRECLDRMVEQSNAMAAKGRCFVTLGYPSYGMGIRLTDIMGTAFDFSVYNDRVAATLRFLPTPQGEVAMKLWVLEHPMAFMPYSYALVGAESRVAAESLMLRGWYLDDGR
jgi:hypothetical protein